MDMLWTALILASRSLIAPAEPITQPSTWIQPEDYPPTAIATGATGAVLVEFRVDQAGRPIGCKVIESSGVDSLDDATCPLIERRARFRPARDADGGAIEQRRRVRLRWSLPPTFELPFCGALSEKPYAVTVDLGLSDDTRVCRRRQPSPPN